MYFRSPNDETISTWGVLRSSSMLATSSWMRQTNTATGLLAPPLTSFIMFQICVLQNSFWEQGLLHLLILDIFGQ